MSMPILLPLLVVIALAVTPIMQRALSSSIQAGRLSLAEKGEAFLSRHDIPRVMRSDVDDMLDGAFPCNCTLAVIFLPLIPFAVWFNRKRTNRRFTELSVTSPDVRGAYFELRALHRKVQLANHPIMVPVSDFVVTLSVLAMVPVLIATRRPSQATIDRDSAAMSLEHTWTKVEQTVAKFRLIRASS